MTKKLVYVAVLAALLGGVFVGGVFLGYNNRPEVTKVTELFSKEIGKPADVDFSPFWRAWALINEKYSAEENIDSQKRVWGAIEGMVKSLGDPYTVFFPPEEAKMFDEDIKGSFGGVGMEIGVRNGVITVIAPLKESPAERAGVKAGDQVIKVDETSTVDMSAEEAAQIIRGDPGTKVKLTIIRKGKDETIEIEVTRDVIKVPIISTETKDGGIFVIKLYNFGGNSVMEFRSALRDFIQSGANKMIIDLRNNPGGYLESAVDDASWFLETGKVVVREKFASGEENIFRSKGYYAFPDLPVVILVNNGSASASEIFAGALQEQGAAKLVGEKTFGKGSVQELVNVTDNTTLKITIAQWLTPNGKSISEEGLEPDFKVELTEEDIDASRDPQMEKAIELLR